MSWRTKLGVAVVAAVGLALPLTASAGEVRVISGDGYAARNVVVERPAVVVRDVRVVPMYTRVVRPVVYAPAYCAPAPVVYSCPPPVVYSRDYCEPGFRAAVVVPRVEVGFFGRIGHGLRVAFRF